MSGTLDLSDVMCKQHHRTAFNLFVNGTKNGDIDGICERNLRPIPTPLLRETTMDISQLQMNETREHFSIVRTRE